ncbi:unnamed protein product [Lasius platythorax]|uniref:Uncharacterized protein n=1 Tax=Lasius platythorax TaxID=488582 RepID=A0AAV2MZ61_9HYME
MNDYAGSLLRWFVSHYGELYGPEYITYNVHNLVHLASDVTRFGCLDQFSAYKFENCLQAIKQQVQNSQRPLHQIVNRITEENALPIQTQIVSSRTLFEICDKDQTSHVRWIVHLNRRL